MLVDSIKRFFGKVKRYPEMIVGNEERTFSETYVNALIRENEFLKELLLKQASDPLSDFTKGYRPIIPPVSSELTQKQEEIMEKAKPRSARFVPFSDAKQRVERRTREMRLEALRKEKDA